MRAISNKFIALVLSIAIISSCFLTSTIAIANSSPVYADQTTSYMDGEISPKKLNTVLNITASSLSKILGDKTSITTITGWISRLSNSTSLVNGGFAILQAMGIIKDPTSESIKNILTVLDEQNAQLLQLSDQINQLADSLKTKQVDDELNKRAEWAFRYKRVWTEFTRTYIEPMNDYMKTYKAWINSEIEYWATGKDKDLRPLERYDIYTYYTIIDDKKTQAFSKIDNKDLSRTENGETIERQYTMALPKTYVDAALKGYTWNVDKYRQDITPLLAEQIKEAMNNNKLVCSDSFKEQWKNAENPEREALAKSIANDMLNTVVYKSSLQAVSRNRNEVLSILNKMDNLWNNMLKEEDGIASLIIPIQKTYCFEGEAKEKITSCYENMISLTSVYGVFTMTLASQLPNYDSTDRTKVRDQWVNGIYALKENQTASLTGYDNYCYVNNKLVTLKKYTVVGESSITSRFRQGLMYNRVRYNGSDSKQWKIVDENNNKVEQFSIVGDIQSGVIFRSWLKTKGDEKTFNDYLKKYGMSNYQDYSNKLITSYSVDNFPLITGVNMLCYDYACEWHHLGDYFKRNKYYRIQTEANRMNKTILHDRVLVNTYSTDIGSYGIKTNDQLVGRAQYCEGHGHWYIDEIYYFCTDKDGSTTSSTQTFVGNKSYRFDYTTKKDIYVLECSDVKKKDKIYADDEFNPYKIISESALYEEIDARYKANTDASILNRSDWNDLDINFFNVVNTKEELNAYIKQSIDDAIIESGKDGKEVSLTDVEQADLATKMANIYNVAKDANLNNNNLMNSYLDPFNLYGNDTAMENLAKRVLPETQIASNGQTIEPVKNMITAAYYEPYVYLDTIKSGESYKLKPMLGYIVTPVLLVWNDDNMAVQSYVISDDIMAEQGLSMRVRLCASFAGKNNALSVIHYDDYESLNKLEVNTSLIQGTGKDRYADITVSRCSMFVPSFTTVTNTGDSTDFIVYYIMLTLSCLAILAIVFLRRRENVR